MEIPNEDHYVSDAFFNTVKSFHTVPLKQSKQ